MSLSYLLKQSTITGNLRSNYELLVAEPGGKILIDTVTNYNQTITADLQTGATLVNVSVIYPYNFAPGQAQYSVYTYKEVNLASWQNIPLSDSVPGVAGPVVNGNATLALENIAVPPAFIDPSAATMEQASARLTNLSSIPLNVPFFDASYYVVNSKTPDSFAVAFPKLKPTYYTFSCMFGSNNNFLLTVPGDSTILDPEKELAVPLQSKFLKGNSPEMFVNGFTMVVDENTNYQSYMTKAADATASAKRPLSNQSVLNVAVNPQGGAWSTRFFQLPKSIPTRQ